MNSEKLVKKFGQLLKVSSTNIVLIPHNTSRLLFVENDTTIFISSISNIRPYELLGSNMDHPSRHLLRSMGRT